VQCDDPVAALASGSRAIHPRRPGRQRRGSFGDRSRHTAMAATRAGQTGPTVGIWPWCATRSQTNVDHLQDHGVIRIAQACRGLRW
jgi:hypothetical protein